jgi:hypothetical protein
MIWLQGIIAVALLGGAIYGWVLLQQKFRGEDDDESGGRKRRKKSDDGSNELETFIAAYRDGKVDPTMLANSEDSVADELAAPSLMTPGLTTSGRIKPSLTKPASATSASGEQSAPAAAATAAKAPTPPATPAMLLRPEVKLAYLLFRTGLRDHHVFPKVRLGDLGFGVAIGTVDLLVCDPGFKYVAAIDIYGEEKPDDVPKAMFLGRAGIKHLLFSSKAMPKPPQLKELIYGKAKA